MTLAAEFGTGQVFWSILWFFLFFLWIWLVITVFGDIIRSDMSGWGKALWTIGIIAVPFFGVFLYLIVNGASMNRRAEADAQAMADAQAAYIRDVAGSGTSPAEQLGRLADLHTAGKLTDDEYAAAKARVVAGV
jgi:hypothetical protein